MDCGGARRSSARESSGSSRSNRAVAFYLTAGTSYACASVLSSETPVPARQGSRRSVAGRGEKSADLRNCVRLTGPRPVLRQAAGDRP